jgi:hypothetical protein
MQRITPPSRIGTMRANRGTRSNSRRLGQEEKCEAIFEKREALFHDKSVERSANFALYMFQVASGYMPDEIDFADVGNNTYPNDQVELMFMQIAADAAARRQHVRDTLFAEYEKFKKGTGRYASDQSLIDLAVEALQKGGISATERKYRDSAANPRAIGGKCSLIGIFLMAMISFKQAEAMAPIIAKSGELSAIQQVGIFSDNIALACTAPLIVGGVVSLSTGGTAAPIVGPALITTLTSCAAYASLGGLGATIANGAVRVGASVMTEEYPLTSDELVTLAKEKAVDAGLRAFYIWGVPIIGKAVRPRIQSATDYLSSSVKEAYKSLIGKLGFPTESVKGSLTSAMKGARGIAPKGASVSFPSDVRELARSASGNTVKAVREASQLYPITNAVTGVTQMVPYHRLVGEASKQTTTVWNSGTTYARELPAINPLPWGPVPEITEREPLGMSPLEFETRGTPAKAAAIAEELALIEKGKIPYGLKVIPSNVNGGLRAASGEALIKTAPNPTDRIISQFYLPEGVNASVLPQGYKPIRMGPEFKEVFVGKPPKDLTAATKAWGKASLPPANYPVNPIASFGVYATKKFINETKTNAGAAGAGTGAKGGSRRNRNKKRRTVKRRTRQRI